MHGLIEAADFNCAVPEVYGGSIQLAMAMGAGRTPCAIGGACGVYVSSSSGTRYYRGGRMLEMGRSRSPPSRVRACPFAHKADIRPACFYKLPLRPTASGLKAPRPASIAFRGWSRRVRSAVARRGRVRRKSGIQLDS
jgi:hypothetical protein